MRIGVFGDSAVADLNFSSSSQSGTTDINTTTLIDTARLLQSLDIDGNTSNGITIGDTAHIYR